MLDEDLKRDAQDAVDALLAEGRLSFPLTVYKIEFDSSGKHRVVSFYDARLGDVVVPWQPPDSFRDAVREAVLRQLKLRDL
jgi:hypothetical protein